MDQQRLGDGTVSGDQSRGQDWTDFIDKRRPCRTLARRVRWRVHTRAPLSTLTGIVFPVSYAPSNPHLLPLYPCSWGQTWYCTAQDPDLPIIVFKSGPTVDPLVSHLLGHMIYHAAAARSLLQT
jgi:hypothetical protein